MLKKVLVILLIFLASTALSGCVGQYAETRHQQTSESQKNDSIQQNGYQPSMTVKPGTNLETVARSLLEKYLKHYMENSIPEPERLKAFKIKEIKLQEKNDSGFVYTAEFSVQGVDENTSWVAGNGIVKNDGWIEDKYMFIKVAKKGNTYTMKEWGTSP